VAIAAPVWAQPAPPSSGDHRQTLGSAFAGRRVVEATPLVGEESITLDGSLDEEVWRRAVPATDFVQLDPDNGAPATERSEVRVVFNSRGLYLGVLCLDSEPDKLFGNQMQRDQPFSADDRFMWVIDTYLDGRTGYFFEINPSGAMGDGLIGAVASGAGGASANKQWDGIWNARVRRTDRGWSAEIELPFRTFNFDADGVAWGINFQRTVRRKNEESLWAGHLRNQGLLRMSNAGLLTGLGRVDQGVGLDVKPHAVASVADTATGPALGDATAGLDLFYNLTPALRANLTINTDFAETEVDDRIVNLTRFSVFFPEKRAFFLEGSSAFDFSREPGTAIVPFFSRRIGLAAGGLPQTIDIGAKLTGQAGRQDIGVLHVRTGRETNAAPEDFTVMRLKRRLLAQSYLGAIYTRRADGDDIVSDRHTAGADFSLATSGFRGSENLELSGFLVWNSNTAGRSGENLAYGWRFSYPNDLWSARISFREIQRNHDPAVGFKQRTGYRRWNPVVDFSPRPRAHPYIRRFRFGANVDLQTDTQGAPLYRQSDLTVLEMDLHSGDGFQLQLLPEYERLDEDFEIVEGITLPVGREYSFMRYRASFNSADRRKVSISPEIQWGEFYSGRRHDVSVGITLRPLNGLRLTTELESNHVRLAEGAFDTRLVRMVGSTQFNPRVAVVNTLQYDSLSGELGWQGRFRWILQPGNDLYFVYTQNWSDDLLTSRFRTRDRKAATKFVYTRRF
jgi:hypothetical protein